MAVVPVGRGGRGGDGGSASTSSARGLGRHGGGRLVEAQVGRGRDNVRDTQRSGRGGVLVTLEAVVARQCRCGCCGRSWVRRHGWRRSGRSRGRVGDRPDCSRFRPNDDFVARGWLTRLGVDASWLRSADDIGLRRGVGGASRRSSGAASSGHGARRAVVHSSPCFVWSRSFRPRDGAGRAWFGRSGGQAGRREGVWQMEWCACGACVRTWVAPGEKVAVEAGPAMLAMEDDAMFAALISRAVCLQGGGEEAGELAAPLRRGETGDTGLTGDRSGGARRP